MGAARRCGEAGQCERRTLASAAELPTSGRAKRGLWRPLRGRPRVRHTGAALFHGTAVKQGRPLQVEAGKWGGFLKVGERHGVGRSPNIRGANAVCRAEGFAIKLVKAGILISSKAKNLTRGGKHAVACLGLRLPYFLHLTKLRYSLNLRIRYSLASELMLF